MENRVALITGGVRGIGRAVGVALGRKGWDVAAAYRKSGDDARSLEEELRAENVRGKSFQADVSDPEVAESLVHSVEAEFGRIDALINCAGPYHRLNILDETIEGWHEMFDNNLHPVFYLSRLVAPGMRRRKWGRIITFAMANADKCMGQPYVTAHYISKVGVLVLARSLAKALAPYGITVNTVSPGFIESGSAPLEELSKAVKNIPAGYIGSLDDAVSVVSWLVSEDARYVNGANIHLSGAWGV